MFSVLAISIYPKISTAWARSQQSGKAEIANTLFKELEHRYRTSGNNAQHLKPGVVVVNAVLNACAYTSIGDMKEQNRAMEIAHKRLNELEKSDYGSPDQITYGTFLKVCANQMPDCHTRQQIIEVIFSKCRADGQVGNLVLQEMRNMGPPDLFYRLIGRDIDDPELKVQDLPQEWRCNVVEGKWRRRRRGN